MLKLCENYKLMFLVYPKNNNVIKKVKKKVSSNTLSSWIVLVAQGFSITKQKEILQVKPHESKILIKSSD